MQVRDPALEASEPTTERADRAIVALEEALVAAPHVDLSWIGRPLSDDGWELAPDVLRLLSSLVSIVRPRHVIEFGSGLSTLVLARAAAHADGCAVSSIDHDPKFAKATGNMLAPGDAAVVSLQCAPLVARPWAGRLLPSYLVDAGRLGSDHAADVILIDGPPAVLGGRLGMLYQALDYAQSGSIVLLDDADRDGEREALAEWQRVLGDAIRVHSPTDFAHGLAAVILAAPNVAQIRMGQT